MHQASDAVAPASPSAAKFPVGALAQSPGGRNPWGVRVGVLVALVLVALLIADLLGARGGGEDSAVRFGPMQSPVAQDLTNESKARLGELGRDRFEVIAFQAIEGQFVGLTEYFYETKMYAVSFAATLRMTRDVHVRTVEESIERQGRDGWTRDELIEDIALRELVGAGDHPKGQDLQVKAGAWFDELDTSKRFRRIAALHDGSTLLRRGTKGAR